MTININSTKKYWIIVGAFGIVLSYPLLINGNEATALIFWALIILLILCGIPVTKRLNRHNKEKKAKQLIVDLNRKDLAEYRTDRFPDYIIDITPSGDWLVVYKGVNEKIIKEHKLGACLILEDVLDLIKYAEAFGAWR